MHVVCTHWVPAVPHVLKFDMIWQRIWTTRPSVFREPEHYLPISKESKWCWIIKCNFKLQEIETNSIITFYSQESIMKLFLWTNKLLFLITQISFASVCVIMNFIDLSLNRSGKSYYELIKWVQHFSNALTSTFVLVWVGHFHGFF